MSKQEGPPTITRLLLGAHLAPLLNFYSKFLLLLQAHGPHSTKSKCLPGRAPPEARSAEPSMYKQAIEGALLFAGQLSGTCHEFVPSSRLYD